MSTRLTAGAGSLPGIPGQGVGALGTLLRRLEAATARLEDIAITHAHAAGAISGASATAAPGASTNAQAGARAQQGGSTTASTTQTGSPADLSKQPSSDGGAATAAAAEGDGPAVTAFDNDVLGGEAYAKYTDLSSELGAQVEEQQKHVVEALAAQRAFIRLASLSKKVSSSDGAFVSLITPTQSALMAAIEVKEKNRGSKQSNHLATVAEGLPALGWVTLDSKPGPFVGEMRDSAQFWANRVVKDHKDSCVSLPVALL